MRIVNIYNGILYGDGQGGGVRYLKDLISEQKKLNIDICVLGVGDGGPSMRSVGDVDVWYVPISKSIIWPIFFINLFVYLLRNRKKYEKTVFHIHRFYFSPLLFLVKKSRVVLTIHTETFSVFKDRFPYFKSLVSIFIWIERVILKNCVDKLTASGSSAINLYQRRFNDLNLDITLLSSGSQLDVGVVSDYILSGVKNEVILVVGRLAAVKRPIEIIKLFAATAKLDTSLLSKYTLVFIGDGEMKNQLNEVIQSSGLKDNIILYGAVENKLMPRVYSQSKALVLLSEAETGPFVIKEALLSGIPVFSTDVGIAKKYIDNECGVVIPIDSPQIRCKEFIKFLNTKYSPEVCKDKAETLIQAENSLFRESLKKLYEIT